MLIKETAHALVACVVTFVVCAVAYPAAVWALGQLLFPGQAEGSLVYDRARKVIGSELIAQPFASDGYFHPRPSAAGPNGYAADAASGSNLGTKNPALRQRITLDVARQIQQHTGDPGLKALLDRLDTEQAELKAKNEIAEKTKSDTEAIAKLEEQVAATQSQILEASVKLGEGKDRLVPPDLVTASGGGLDPHISPEAARYQASRVAAARKLTLDRVRDLIDRHIERSGAIIGAPPRVNVLRLNRALDEEKPAPESTAAVEEVTPTAPAGASEPAPGPGDPSRPTGPAAEAKPATSELSGDVAVLRTQIGGLAGQLDQLSKQIEASRDDKAAAGLKDLEARVAALAENTARASALAEQVGRIDERVKAVGENLQQIRSEIVETRASLEKQAAPGPAPAAAAEATRPASDRGAARPDPGIDLGPGLASFRQGRYAEAANTFRALTRDHPDDARAWYYAALANGLATGQWTGQTEELVKKGVERERAGTPKASEIDAALSDLTQGTGRDWLSFFRRGAAQR
jgi:K+-transporting ATPase c subunit